MRNFALFAFLFFCALPISAQRKTVIGQIGDSFSNEPVMAHVTIMRPDSSVVDTVTAIKERNSYTAESYNATFSLTVGGEGKYIIRFEKEGYQALYRTVNVKVPKRAGFFNIGFVKMMRDKHYLNEVTVTATKIKMVMKGDTVVYNADAFQLAQGSMLDALVKQLPGVELKSDGRIYQNGKFVEALLVNGKDFFAGDPKVALDNLPAYMVKNVKIYDKQKGNGVVHDFMNQHLVMDVNLKKQYNIGWIANADLAGGTKHRYLGKVFAMRFTDHSKLAIYGTMNNLSDEQTPGEATADWNPQDRAQGLLTLKKTGLSYQWSKTNSKGISFSAHTDNTLEFRSAHNDVYTMGETFLSGGNAFNRSFSKSYNTSTFFSSYNQIEVNFPNYSDVIGGYWVNYARKHQEMKGWSGNFSADPSKYINGNILDSLFTDRSGSAFRRIISNRMRQERLSNSNYLRTALWGQTDIFTHKGSNDYIVLNFSVQYNRSTDKQFDHYLLQYPNTSVTSDYRNRFYNKPTNGYEIRWNMQYNYDIRRDFVNGGATIYFTPKYQLRQIYTSNENSLYRLDKLNGWGEQDGSAIGQLPSTLDSLQMAVDANNSYHSTLHNTMHTFDFQSTFCFNLNKTPKDKTKTKEILSQFHLNFADLQNRLHYYRDGKAYPLRRERLFFSPSAYIRYNYHKANYTFNYWHDADLPAPTYLLDIRDDSDPLNISLGNGALKSRHEDNFSFVYQEQTERGASINAKVRYSIYQNNIAMGFVYDKATGVRTIKPENVNGNWVMDGSVMYTRPLDKKNYFVLTTNTTFTYNNNVDLVSVAGATSSSRSIVHNLLMGEDLRFDFRPTKNIKLGTKMVFSWTNATSRRSDFETVNVANFNYGVTGLVELPWQMQFSTDLTMFSRRGYQEASMNTNELVWNARLAKRLLHGNLTFALDGFDILGNLSNVQRALNAQGRTETYYNVVPRYAMLHIIYRLNIQSKKQKSEN